MYTPMLRWLCWTDEWKPDDEERRDSWVKSWVPPSLPTARIHWFLSKMNSKHSFLFYSQYFNECPFKIPSLLPFLHFTLILRVFHKSWTIRGYHGLRKRLATPTNLMEKRMAVKRLHKEKEWTKSSTSKRREECAQAIHSIKHSFLSSEQEMTTIRQAMHRKRKVNSYCYTLFKRDSITITHQKETAEEGLENDGLLERRT